MDTGTLLSTCLSGFKKDAEHMCSCFNMSTLHHMLEWEQDRFGCFEGGSLLLLVVVLENIKVISKLWTVNKKRRKDGFANG